MADVFLRQSASVCGLQLSEYCENTDTELPEFAVGKRGRPCANTVENWVKKLGYYQVEIRGTEGLSGDLCLIMDESMCVGPYRQLLILAAEANKTNDLVLDMKQVRVVHSSVAKVYNGEEIAGFIAEFITNYSRPSKPFQSSKPTNG